MDYNNMVRTRGSDRIQYGNLPIDPFFHSEGCVKVLGVILIFLEWRVYSLLAGNSEKQGLKDLGPDSPFTHARCTPVLLH